MKRFSSRTTVVSLATVISFVVVAGCSSSSEPAAEPEVLGTAASALGRNWDIPMNGLRTESLVRNLLSTNYENSGEFVASPLTSATFSTSGGHPALATAVTEPGTLELLRYAVTCALDPEQAVQISLPGGGVSFRGQLGLCPEWGAPNGAASIACQERVSACLLLFNNPRGAAVPVSVRGPKDPVNKITLMTRVQPVSATEDKAGTDPGPAIASLGPCPPGSRGVDTNCGYNRTDELRGYVGTCTHGETVRIGTGAPCSTPLLGWSTGDTVLRVCDGMRGCDTPPSAEITRNDDAACGGLASYVTFPCPDSGVYSVMLSSWNRDVPATAWAAAAASTGSSYPSLEIDLFKVREGSFFGNIFLRDALTVSYTYGSQGWVPHPRNTSPNQYPTPYGAMFACYDPLTWSTGTAYTTKRLCAAGLGTCAAKPVGDCNWYCAPPAPLPSRYGAYGGCSYNGTWSWPLTSYLHTKTDVLGPACGATCN